MVLHFYFEFNLAWRSPTEESLELDDEEDHIANLKLIFEENKREARDDDLKEHDDDDDPINWKTDSIPKPFVNLNERKSRTSIFNFQELTLRNAIEMLRKQFLKPPTISFRRAKLENVYRRILSLVEKEENYSNNIFVFYSTLLPSINENLRVSNDGILDHVTKTVDKILKTPVISPYFERLTGISDLKEALSFSYLYQEFNNTLELLGLEDNDFNRKLVTKYKESIKNFIELVKEDMHVNIIPVDSIYFILDKLEEIAPFIENQSQVKGNYAAGSSKYSELQK
ncbi:hypothetical protein Anas_05878 [Armadillidium nasatum]|uniref:Uncharacterized protein n=1 Tax=Armadillidium nasatum TaxID=96803 RepID=A0A5N5TAI6_9CRUS|nr:hypothetical protein Anas_05878 [Armadillidium nasatum]